MLYDKMGEAFIVVWKYSTFLCTVWVCICKGVSLHVKGQIIRCTGLMCGRIERCGCVKWILCHLYISLFIALIGVTSAPAQFNAAFRWSLSQTLYMPLFVFRTFIVCLCLSLFFFCMFCLQCLPSLLFFSFFTLISSEIVNTIVICILVGLQS